MNKAQQFSRRSALEAVGCGFGSIALAGLLNQPAMASPINSHPVTLGKKTKIPARAKRVIFIFMQGGPSHVDSFDYKPILEKRNGESIAFDDDRTIANTG